MSKDVRKDSVNLRLCRRKESQGDTTAISNSKRTIEKNTSTVETESCNDGSHKRLSKLKHAIGDGRFTVNSTRVAEKLIQFEIQLLT